jgi:hypothetical protein
VFHTAACRHCSYYYDGLSLAEFKKALDELLKLGRNSQQLYYNEWLDLSAGVLGTGKTC